MTRMRYKKQGQYLVSPVMIVGENLAYVRIDPVQLTYNINDSSNDMTLFSGECDTMAKIKKEAKSTLKALGAKFSDELRATSKLELE